MNNLKFILACMVMNGLLRIALVIERRNMKGGGRENTRSLF
jgi:hypothetical protein